MAELAAFVGADEGVGAVASFIGYCRATSGGRAVERLELEHYPGFTEAAIERLAEPISTRHKLASLLVTHRVGAIFPGEAIVLVAAMSPHRAAAFAAVSELMDYLKTDAPIWKREVGPSGACWVAPTEDDRARRAALDTEET